MFRSIAYICHRKNSQTIEESLYLFKNMESFLLYFLHVHGKLYMANACAVRQRVRTRPMLVNETVIVASARTCVKLYRWLSQSESRWLSLQLAIYKALSQGIVELRRTSPFFFFLFRTFSQTSLNSIYYMNVEIHFMHNWCMTLSFVNLRIRRIKWNNCGLKSTFN